MMAHLVRGRATAYMVAFAILAVSVLLWALPILAAPQEPDAHRAITLLAEGSRAFQLGRYEDAARSWEEAREIYHRLERPLDESHALGLLGQGLQSVGQYQEAGQMLDLALALARSEGARAWETELHGKLGALYLASGQMEAAGTYLKETVAIARTSNFESVVATALNDLGRWYAHQSQFEQAVKAFSESAVLAKMQNQQSLELRAVLNNAGGLIQLRRFQDANKWRALAQALVQDLPDTHEKIVGLVSSGLLAAELSTTLATKTDALTVASAHAFRQAATLAESRSDRRSASYAWGYLGRLYELGRRNREGLQLSHRAARLAQLAEAPESLFRWQWQTGRLLAAEGQLDAAIESYSQAMYTLQPLRPELAESSEPQGPAGTLLLSTRQLYLQLADLLFQRATLTDADAAQTYLSQARDVVELQKVAEVRDYYRDECVDALHAHTTRLDSVSPTTGILYPIVFADRTEILLSIPSGLKRVTVPVSAANLTREVRSFRRLLERRTTREYLPHAQQLYAWLIAPLEGDLTSNRIDTLVIVPDAALRTIPLAALHDGRDFLIKKYAVATTPGLTLTDSRPIKRARIRVLAGGLTEAVRGFPPLPDVATELNSLQNLYAGEQLVDQQFVLPNLAEDLKETPYTVVHLASHGKFEPDVRNTYLLTYDGRLTMDGLAQMVGLLRFRQEPLELLTLSACETAAGNDNAALGLAGVAIKAGAKSALATLWYINDQASARLVTEFYSHLQKGARSKAAALQSAQQLLLSDPIFEHPAYWSPFLLLNNWQ